MGAEPWQDDSGFVFSGPMVMGLADTAMYGCVMAALGADVIPVMANLNITFLRPARACDLVAEARIVRRGSGRRGRRCGGAGGDGCGRPQRPLPPADVNPEALAYTGSRVLALGPALRPPRGGLTKRRCRSEHVRRDDREAEGDRLLSG